MGTVFQLDIPEQKNKKIEEKIFSEVYHVFETIDQLMSSYKKDSEISKLGDSSGIAPIKVSRQTFEVIEQSLFFSQVSDGAFDITWAALKDYYEPDSDLEFNSKIAKEIVSLINYNNIIIDKNKQMVFLKNKGMKIGIGAIAKGYALDEAKKVLDTYSIKDFFLNGGGDLLVGGNYQSQPWIIHIQHPDKPDGFIGKITATNNAIMSSGGYQRFRVLPDGKILSHIVHPQTGMPADDLKSITIIGKIGTAADALATAFFVLGNDNGNKMLKKMQNKTSEPYYFLSVDKDNHILFSCGLKKSIEILDKNFSVLECI